MCYSLNWVSSPSQLGITYVFNEHTHYSTTRPLTKMLVATLNPRQYPVEATSMYLLIQTTNRSLITMH